jgi:predicted O-linked N-acetylglucosamine transferase (SPINDLY family)
VLQDLKRNAEALDSYALAIRYQPNLLEAHLKQGMLLNNLQRFSAALDSFAAAIALAPTASQAYCQRGIALQELKRYPEALQSYDRAISLEPAYADAYCNRGITLQSLKRLAAALADFATALALKPDYAQAYNNRGNALRIQNHSLAALASYEQALAISPDFAEAYCNRGLALYELKRFDEALQSCEQALALKADFAQAYDNRGIILENLNRYPEALHSFELAMSINPALDFIAGQCLSAKLMLCDWQQLDEQIHSLLGKLDNGQKVINPFVMLAVSDDAALQRRAAELFVADNQTIPSELPAQPHYSGHQRIKIGYFSADFCQHPVALLSAGLYRLHDRSRFEIYAFSFTVKTDDITLELQTSFEHFYDIRQMSDQEVAALVLSLEIDIAVDLGGHTSNSRSSLFSKRIAPLQISYLGYSGTLGSNYMDYLLADPVLIPQSSQRFYSETIACLPHSYMVNDNTRPISSTAICRAEFGLPEQGLVFCCFNNTYKLNPQLFDSWMRILAQVTDSVLWLSAANATAMDNLRREAENRGIAAERLIFAQRLPLMADHLARLQLADLFLDTLPYNAHTTSSDALWAGLPVLTCKGESFAGRVAASLLTAIKLPELITDSPAAYETLAITLAQQPQTLAAIRTKLATNRLTTPLFDTALFTRDLEALYQRIYTHQQHGLPPAPIYP